MNNYLTTLLGLNIYLYGFGVFLTTILTLFLYWRNLHQTSFNEEKYLDLLFSASLVGLAIGRLVYILFNYSVFEPTVLKAILLLTYPGVNEFGFWVGFLAVFYLYSTKHKVNKNTLIKMLYSPLLIGRVFLSVFSTVRAMELAHLVVTFVYLIMLGLGLLLGRAVKNNKFKENVLWFYLFIALAVPNFIIDFFKPDRVYFLELKILSIEQLPYLLTILIAMGWLLFNYLKARRIKKHE